MQHIRWLIKTQELGYTILLYRTHAAWKREIIAEITLYKRVRSASLYYVKYTCKTKTIEGSVCFVFGLDNLLET